MSKKGMEMSVNVLVGIILGVIMFGAALFIFFRIMNQSNDSACALDKQTEDKMKMALDTGDPVYVPSNNIKTGDGCAPRNSAFFTVGIRNVGDTPQQFTVVVTCMDPCPPGLVASEIAYLPGPYMIPVKDNEFLPIAVNMKGVTQKATLLVTVKNSTGGTYWKPKIVNIQP